MKSGLQRCVIDSSVLIDLYHGKVLKRFLKMDFSFSITNLIKHELRDPPWETLKAANVMTHSLKPSEMARIQKVRETCLGPTVCDISALVLAQRLRCMLLTSDKDLRRQCKEDGVEIHGVLWILDLLIQRNVLSAKEACLAVKKMLENNSRLPLKDVKERIAEWSK